MLLCGTYEVVLQRQHADRVLFSGLSLVESRLQQAILLQLLLLQYGHCAGAQGPQGQSPPWQRPPGLRDHLVRMLELVLYPTS